MFSIPSKFPAKNDLLKFGYTLNNDELKFNLAPSLEKERNVNLMLSNIHKTSKGSNSSASKRKSSADRSRPKASKKQKLPEQLID